MLFYCGQVQPFPKSGDKIRESVKGWRMFDARDLLVDYQASPDGLEPFVVDSFRMQYTENGSGCRPGAVGILPAVYSSADCFSEITVSCEKTEDSKTYVLDCIGKVVMLLFVHKHGSDFQPVPG